jgi:peroxiredoxin
MSNYIQHSSSAKSTKNVAVPILVALVALSAMAATPSLVPRRSPDFRISEPSGESILLSKLRGKVVVMEFLFLQSNHCTRVAQMLNKLNVELGPRGFQALGVVFDPPNVPDSHGHLVAPAVTFFKLTYPVGYSSKVEVDSYLGRKQREVLNIPQIIVIDRAGMIRAASGTDGGDPRLEDEASLRGLIEGLLDEARR